MTHKRPPFSPSHSPQMVQRRDSYAEKGFWRPVSVSTGMWGSSSRPEKTQLRTSGWDGDAWALGIAAIPVPTSQSGKRHHSCGRRKRCRRFCLRERAKSCALCSVMSDSLVPHGLYPARLLRSWNFTGKNTGVGFHALLHGIFPT